MNFKQWQRELRRQVSSANTEPDMVHHSGKSSKSSKLPKEPSMSAPSQARSQFAGKLAASGNASLPTERLQEVHGNWLLPLLSLLRLPSIVSADSKKAPLKKTSESEGLRL